MSDTVPSDISAAKRYAENVTIDIFLQQVS